MNSLKKTETLLLYNHYHNGDLFYSRILLKILGEKFNIKYFHNCKKGLFCDLHCVEEYDLKNLSSYRQIYNYPVINTWIGQDDFKYLKSVNYGCSFENHLFLAKHLASQMGVSTHNNYDEYIPTINYRLIPQYEEISNIMESLKKSFSHIVLLSNGDVQSGQSQNFDFSKIIEKLSIQHPEILFLITKNIVNKNKNIIYTSDITNIIPDLLQISYISSYCNIIIGRASGPFCFAHTKENLLNPEKIFISFCNNKHEGIFYEKQKSKFAWHNNYSSENIIEIINKCIIYENR
jgi:hypothetical protein